MLKIAFADQETEDEMVALQMLSNHLLSKFLSFLGHLGLSPGFPGTVIHSWELRPIARAFPKMPTDIPVLSFKHAIDGI